MAPCSPSARTAPGGPPAGTCPEPAGADSASSWRWPSARRSAPWPRAPPNSPSSPPPSPRPPHTPSPPYALASPFPRRGAARRATRLVLAAAGRVVLGPLGLSPGGPRHGLVVRAGVEDRAMVTALGIDVRKAFTLVFAIGGAAAALAGALGGLYF